MITFFVAVIILVVGYIFYSRFSERIFAIDKNRLTPAIDHPDGVDVTPLSKFKAFLIELLNIAGTGPIFGAISGALFGPIVFIWIVVGCLVGGGVHDYFCGMISSRNDGKSIVFLAGKYIGKIMRVVMTIFSLLLLILVTTVFVVSPSSLLEELCGGNVPALVFMIVIILYYLVATILPIDKLIGKFYPIFGLVLITMAVGVIVGIFIKQQEYPLIELVGNFRDFSASVGGLPWWPFMLTTVACGAISGFHATQAPMISKCIKNEKEGRQVFYGAMVAEGIIALIWAAAAMSFYHLDSVDGMLMLSGSGGGNSSTVYNISKSLLGPIGSILAVVGVVICPITSGDTALRSARLIISELLKLDQKKIRNRLIITVPLFVVIAAISAWNFLDPQNFNLLWRWFAWCNQVLATIALLVCTVYLIKESKHAFAPLLTGLPMCVMIAVLVTYIFNEPNIALGQYIDPKVGIIIGACAGGIVFLNLLIQMTILKVKGHVFEDRKKEISH